MGPFKFLLELDAKIKGGARGMHDLLGKMTGRLRGMVRPLKLAERSLGALGGVAYGTGRAIGYGMRGVGWAVGKAGDTIKRFGADALATFTGMATLSGMQALVRGAWNMTKGLLAASDQAARTSRSFEVLFGADKGNTLERTVEAIGKKSPFDPDVLKDWVLDLREAGFNSDRLAIALRAATDQAVRFKDKGARLKAIGDALESIAQRGELSERALRAAGIQAPKFWEGVAARMGKTVAVVKKLNQDGKIAQDILSAEMIDQMAAASGGVIGPETALAGKRPLAAFERLLRAPEEIAQAMGQSPALARLGEQFDRIAAVLDPETATGKRVIESIEKVATAVAGALGKIDVEKWTGIMLSAFEKLPAAVKVGIQTVDELLRVTQALIRAWDTLSGKKEATAGSGKAATAGAIARAAVVEPIAKPFNSSFGESVEDILTLGHLGQKTKDVWDWAWGQGKYAAQGAAEGVKGGTPQVEGALQSMADRGRDAFAGKLAIRSPSKVFDEMGYLSGEGYAQGLERSRQRIGQAMERAVDITPMSTDPERVAGGGGTTTINVPITVEYSGNGSREELEELARRIRDVVPGAVASAFSKVRLAQGGLA